MFSKLIISLCFISLVSASFLTQKQEQASNDGYKFQESVNVSDFYTNITDNTRKNEFYTGHISVGPNVSNVTSKMFYQLVTAQYQWLTATKPTTPMILWLQGGPGCSSSIGNYNEIGPLFAQESADKKTQFLVENGFSWANQANLLFVDSPIGVGYSVKMNGDTASNSSDAALNLEQFLVRFYQVYPQLAGTPFYIFGESYGGHYIPALARRLIENKANNGITLSGVGIGDGWTDPIRQGPVYSNYAYSAGIISGGRRSIYRQYENQIVTDLLNGDVTDAVNKFNIFSNENGADNIVAITGASNTNYRNYEGTFDSSDAMLQFLKNQTVKTAFNIDSNVTFSVCNDPIYAAFTNDIVASHAADFTVILANTRVLLYSGQDDLVVPTPGSLEWINSGIQWAQMQDFQASPKSQWKVNNLPVGTIKRHGNLAFALVNKAGHLVPGDQPENSLDLVSKFINNEW